MGYLTPSERRAALVIVLLLALGTVHDLWRLAHPRRALPEPGGPATAEGEAGWGTSPRPAAEPVAERIPAAPRSPESPPRPPLDLNRASAAELDALPGVGPVLAARIVEQRRKYGPFQEVDDLLAVRGIGPRLLARLRPHVAVRPPRG